MTVTFDKHTVGKASVCGALGATVAGAQWGWRTPVRIPMIDRQIPVVAAAGGASFAASILSDATVQTLFPAWERDMVGSEMNGVLASGILGAGLNVGLLSAMDPNASIMQELYSGGIWGAAAVGAGVEIVGGGMYNNFVMPMMA